MKPIDIKPLVNFAIAVIAIAIATNQYSKLREFVIKEFVKSLNPHSTIRLNSFNKERKNKKIHLKKDSS